MSQDRAKIVDRLATARAEQSPVTVHRKHLDEDRTSGFVVTVTDDWVVLQDLVAGAHLDAVVLLRLDQVTKIEPHGERDYLRRAVSGLGVPAAEFDCPPNASTGELLRLAAERTELTCVYLESRDGYWLNIGKILCVGERRLDLHFIGRDGAWADFIESWKLRDITRIEFGGLYISALEQFGDPRPEVSEVVKR